MLRSALIPSAADLAARGNGLRDPSLHDLLVDEARRTEGLLVRGQSSRAALRRGLPVLAAAAGLTLAHARPAEACSPQSHIDHIVPDEGETHPANAAIVFFGAFYEDFNVTVLVDDTPAAIVKVPELSGPVGPYSDALAFMIAPQPGAGQTVTLTFCDPENCAGDIMHSFTTGPADNSPPPPVEALAFDVHEHGLTAPGTGACIGPRDTAYWVRFTSPAPGGAPIMHRVKGSALEGGSPAAGFDLFHEGAEGMTVKEIRRKETVILEPSSACVRVESIDYALNVGETVEVCGACQLRQDEAGAGGQDPPGEPAWTADDVAPGGPCDDSSPGETETGSGTGTGGTGDATGGGTAGTDSSAGTGLATETGADSTETRGTDEGCGCRTPGGGWSGVLVLLALARRRR